MWSSGLLDYWMVEVKFLGRGKAGSLSNRGASTASVRPYDRDPRTWPDSYGLLVLLGMTLAMGGIYWPLPVVATLAVGFSSLG